MGRGDGQSYFRMTRIARNDQLQLSAGFGLGPNDRA